MSKLFIKNVLLNGEQTNIRISGTRFSEISPSIVPQPGEEVIDGTHYAIVPPFYNGHTHAAMTLLRGYADDMALFPWLNDYIWPFEAKLTANDIYIGSRLAILEMIKSGTIFFNDMYWESEQTFRATEEMGIRAAIGMSTMDSQSTEAKEKIWQNLESFKGKGERTFMTVAPHAPYTVSEPLWIQCAEMAKKYSTLLHFHLSETEKEVKDCIEAHGTTPVRWLDKMGVLGPNCIAAHVVYVDEEEIEILKERGVTIVHNPVSNMKLASGYFKSQQMQDPKLKVLIGTDGCSSNNNLDMREEAKFAAMIAKCNYGPDVLPVETVVKWCTSNGAQAFGIDAGEIATGKLADALLIDLNNERFIPNFNLSSNWIYASSNEAFDTLICNGKVVMRNRHVEGEEEIIAEAQQCCRKWMKG